MDSLKETLSQNAHILRAKVSKYAIYGLTLAVIAILTSTFLVSYLTHHTLSLEGILEAQKTNPAIWLLDATPFLFAFWGQYVSSVISYEASAMIIDQTSELRMHTSALESQVMHNLTHDSLTGLPNRILFIDRLNQALTMVRVEKGDLAIFMIYVSQLQEVNKSLGRYNGDRVLHQFAVRLKGVFQEPATIARLDNDLFGVLIPKIKGKDGVKDYIDRISHALKNPFALEGLSLQLRVNIGVVISPEHGADSDTLLQRSEVAMSAAKQENEDYVIYSPDLDKDSQRLLILASDLQRAIDADSLTLFYQPKINIKTHEISVETLLRWQHPQFGLINPQDFIPLAERTGLIKSLSTWVMTHAFKQCAKWHKENLPIGISVNLSTIDLMDVELPDKIGGSLAGLTIDPQWVILEITEGAIMKDQDRALENLTRLVELGLAISIDDFGTGYSSLAYLSKLPASELKIDKSFVHGMMKSAGDKKIVKATIDLAHNLSLKVVAEGVEDAQTYAQLKNLGCDVVQGFYLSEALPVGELEKWYQAGSWKNV